MLYMFCYLRHRSLLIRINVQGVFVGFRGYIVGGGGDTCLSNKSVLSSLQWMLMPFKLEYYSATFPFCQAERVTLLSVVRNILFVKASNIFGILRYVTTKCMYPDT